MILYELLGVSKTASLAEIKAAFRVRATQLHPDRGGDPRLFSELSLAYDILSEPLKRSQYDATGVWEQKALAAEVTSAVAAMSLEAFSQEHMHPIRWMWEEVDRQRGHHHSERSKLLKEIDKLQRRLDQFKVENQGSRNLKAVELIAQAVTRKLASLVVSAQKHEKNIVLGEKILEFLDGLKRTRSPDGIRQWKTPPCEATNF
jgi:curved DNA-binding protein CbpA